jgi:hypothetical protein
MTAKTVLLPLLVTLVALAAPAQHADAASDFKFVSALDCVAFAPNTQPSELQMTAAGLYNFGSTYERVICPLPRDQDDAYLSGDVDITVYYRGLGAPAHVGCTLYVGSSFMQAGAIYTSSAIGNPVGNGGRGALVITGASQDTEFSTNPALVICTLEPKMALAGLFFNESGPTNTP